MPNRHNLKVKGAKTTVDVLAGSAARAQKGRDEQKKATTISLLRTRLNNETVESGDSDDAMSSVTGYILKPSEVARLKFGADSMVNKAATERLFMKRLFGNLERVFGNLDEVPGSRAPAKTFVELSVCFQF